MTRVLSAMALGGAMLFAPPAAATQAGPGPSAADQPPIQARPGGPDDAPRSDQTVDVARGTRLVMTSNAGEVVVRSWDRDAVRVEATHGPRERIDVQVAELTLRVRARTERGPQGLVDYRITVPRWMPINLSGTYLDADVEGTGAEVTIETVRGTARVRGGSGAISVRSVQGQVIVEDATGRVQASSVNESIRLAGVSGDVTAETTNGDISLLNMKAANVEVSTVNGDVTFDGGVVDKGAYRIATHNGRIRVGLGGTANATVFVRTFRGRFSSDFPITLPEGQAGTGGNVRFNFTLGSGSARIELQSFGGNIFIARGALPPEADRSRRPGTPAIAPVPRVPATPTPPRQPAPRPPGGREFADAWWADLDKALARPDEADIQGAVQAALSEANVTATVQAAVADASIGAALEAALDSGHTGGVVGAAIESAGVEAAVSAALDSVDISAAIDAAIGTFGIDGLIEAAIGAALDTTGPRASSPRRPR
jgi:DUF4097 and DUF4098 domain-containing protein YvlB